MNTIDSTVFRAVNAEKAEGVLFSRLNSVKRTLQFEEYKTLNINKSYDIELSGGSNNSLTAYITNKHGYGMTVKEYELYGKLNINPLRFLKNISRMAELNPNIVYPYIISVFK